jgi:hypothetical protein
MMLAHAGRVHGALWGLAVGFWLAGLVPRAVAADPPQDEPYEEPEFIREPPRLPEGVDPGSARRLSLADAIALAVKANLGIVLVKQQVQIAALGIEQSLGAFEPTLNASYSHQSEDFPAGGLQNTTTLGSLTESTSDRWLAGYAQRLRLGTQVAPAAVSFGAELAAHAALAARLRLSLGSTERRRAARRGGHRSRQAGLQGQPDRHGA